MEDLQQPPAKRGQPSKLDEHPLIPIGEFEDRMREVLSVTPEELLRRESQYQREQAERRKARTSK